MADWWDVMLSRHSADGTTIDGSNGLSKFLIRSDRKFITTLIFRMAAVGCHMMKVHRVQVDQFVQPFPQIVVLNWLKTSFFPPSPAVFFPACHPGLQPLADIFAVGVKINKTGAFEGQQPLDDRRQFHAVIGGVGFRTKAFHFFSRGDMAEDKRPSTGAGIAAATAVGVKLHPRQADGVLTTHPLGPDFPRDGAKRQQIPWPSLASGVGSA